MSNTAPYDALLLVSFGGPEGPDDVVPFLENVTRGRGIPPERLARSATHYFGSAASARSTSRTARCCAVLRRGFADRGSTCRSTGATATGTPYLAETPAPDGGRRRQRRVAGLRHQRVLLVLLLPAVPREPPRGRCRPVGPRGAEVDKMRHVLRPPRLRRADGRRGRWPRCRRLPEDVRDGAAAGVRHPLDPADAPSPRRPGPQRRRVRRPAPGSGRGWSPTRVSRRTGLASRTTSSSARAAARRRCRGWSRTSTTTCATSTAQGATSAVVLVPIGFVSDHMEVIYDLDTEAAPRPRRSSGCRSAAPPRSGPTRASSPSLRRSGAGAGGGGARGQRGALAVATSSAAARVPRCVSPRLLSQSSRCVACGRRGGLVGRLS